MKKYVIYMCLVSTIKTSFGSHIYFKIHFKHFDSNFFWAIFDKPGICNKLRPFSLRTFIFCIFFFFIYFFISHSLSFTVCLSLCISLESFLFISISFAFLLQFFPFDHSCLSHMISHLSLPISLNLSLFLSNCLFSPIPSLHH